MLDHTLAQVALWNRALSVVVCTTGSTSLSATSLGFARGSGSFITDGFAAGMEVTGSGFSAANNSAKIIEGVTAGFLTIKGGCAVQSATAGRTLTVGLPAKRARDNIQLLDADAPLPGSVYIDEQYVTTPKRKRTTASDGGMLEITGIYVLTIFGIANTGSLAIRRLATALEALYTPGTFVIAGSDTVTMRGDPGAEADQIVPQENGFARCVIRIPWRCYTRNVIAA
jgi:hypothetical protein